MRAITTQSFTNRDGIKKRHHGAELSAHDLDLLTAFLITEFIHGLAAVLIIFVDEALGEFALLDILQDALHFLLRLLGNDARAGDVVAPLRCVRDRIAHVVEATTIHEINDKLQLMHALEVSDLRLIAGVDERLEAGLNQLSATATQHRLLTE